MTDLRSRPPAGQAGRGVLTLDRIVGETLALMDEQGIGAASMRTVGERLGVRAMSLYRHVANREALLDAVVERIVNELADDLELRDATERGWRPYLADLAWGVRRYALAHPHAFPLVATRPSEAPWVNPPLRSLRWIESMLANLTDVGFSDDEALFVYRSFNSFLLGYLLLETSAVVLCDPKEGDGSFQSGDGSGDHDPVHPADPVPGALAPSRTTAEREALERADTPRELLDPLDVVSAEKYPVIHRMFRGLTADRYEEEFTAGLELLLDRIAARRGER